METWVVVPFFNEEKALPKLLDRFTEMSPSFAVMFCDNGSTDGSKKLVSDFINSQAEAHRWDMVVEPEKGTGAAADTAIRAAINRGARFVLRTDADCIPALDWVDYTVDLFKSTDLQFVTGKIVARTDDSELTRWQETVFNALPPVAAFYGRYRPLNQDMAYKGPYVMAAGCNLAITADLYEQCGGFPRTKIEDVHEDHELVNRVRLVTNRYCYDKKMVVQVSARRVVEWGIFNTLRWYANHSYRPRVVDIR